MRRRRLKKEARMAFPESEGSYVYCAWMIEQVERVHSWEELTV